MDSGIINSQFSSQFQSISPRVEFTDIQDHYSFNEDLICKYLLTNYEVQEGDRIAIFKLGWNYVKEYVLFEWVPRDGGGDDLFVTFNKLCLPKTNLEIYQFCFISGENNVLGASEPFQFCDQPKNYQSLFIKDINLPDNTKSMSNNFSFISSTDVLHETQEMTNIRDENELLRNTLRVIVSDRKNYDPDIQQLKKITCDLQAALNIQQGQIKDLQKKLSGFKLENRKLENENILLQKNCTMLKNRNDYHFIKTPLDIEIGELQPLPPFPFAK